MDILIEGFPFVFGLLLGVSCERTGGLRRRPILWGAGAIALGCFATLASGEWRVSPVYFLFDVGLVSAVAVATVIALQWLRRRRASQ